MHSHPSLPPIVLASASPRRSALFSLFGLPFAVVPSGVEEVLPRGADGAEASMSLAAAKGEEVYTRLREERPDAIVLAFDTLVELEGRIFGKPADEEEARTMLRALSGRAHLVYTGYAVFSPHGRNVGYERTVVRFRPLAEEEISAYLATGEPFGKAGAYAAQGQGGIFVEGVEGDFANVVGLPLSRVALILRALGIHPLPWGPPHAPVPPEELGLFRKEP
ncbi:Maf family protein [Brockia lithotrophica]|uniref:dTTP/UTP pyrophosphatase n=1 Tax=Brockia lithotrophica TaxID=933949 RepID=A0A660L7B7_9BACL|nr:Maf family protein [Brockia lithotrophica]RKQ89104.1 septum formation protein [Brockia lithotrophica]